MTIAEVGRDRRAGGVGRSKIAGRRHKGCTPSRRWAESWSIPKADLVLNMTQAVALPASGDIEYPYEIVPTNFKEDRWVQMAEVLPTLRSNVHHAVVYVRPPDSNWLRHARAARADAATHKRPFRDPAGRRTTGSRRAARFPMTPRCSAFFRTCTCEESASNTT